MKTTTLTLSLIIAVMFAGQAQTGYDFFDENNIEALISPHGNHFWDEVSSQFYIPKDSNTTSIFAFSSWIGAMSNDTMYLAAERFRQNGEDYKPGPIGDQSTYEPAQNAPWNRVWKITADEVRAWQDDPINVPIPQVVLDWPAHGDTTVGQAYYLAPFYDQDNDGVYDPVNAGDCPRFKGDQAVYFMYNDGWIHTESGGRSLDVEIHGMAYGFECDDDTAINNTLFMEYNIINRSDRTYSDSYFGMWTDFDLGNAQDDYLGSDPFRSLFYAYNGDNDDQDAGGAEGYMSNLPAQGLRIIDGFKMDDDNADNVPSTDSLGNFNGFNMDDGVVDNERLGLSYFIMHGNTTGPTGSPTSANDYYNYLTGHWRDGAQLTFHGTGYDPANSNAVPARFMFPDSSDLDHFGTYGVDPDTNYWHEATAGNAPSDRRGYGSTGPFTMKPGEMQSMTFALVFAQKEGDRIAAVEKMKNYSDKVKVLYDSGETDCGPFEHDFQLFEIGIAEDDEFTFNLFPNPAESNIRVSGIHGSAKATIWNTDGRKMINATIQDSEEIDVSGLASGQYILEVKSEGHVGRELFVKR